MDRFQGCGSLASFLRSTRGDRLHPLWRFLSHTGLSRGEALGLHLEDLDLDAGTVVVRRQLTKSGSYEAKEGPLKAGKPRTIDLGPATVEALREQLQQQLADAEAWGSAWTANPRYLFTREDGPPLHPDDVYIFFIRAAEATGVPRIRLHDLRHTWATLAIPAGVPMKVVQERLDHSSIKTTTDLYSHVMPGMQRSASAIVAALVADAAEGK